MKIGLREKEDRINYESQKIRMMPYQEHPEKNNNWAKRPFLAETIKNRCGRERISDLDMLTTIRPTARLLKNVLTCACCNYQVILNFITLH